MGFAAEADIPVVLIGDIDRGGVIASIVGTHTILDDADRGRIAGYLINKFRGDVSLFDEGLQQISGYTGWSSYGVLPWLDAVGRLPAEDSVALDKLVAGTGSGVRIVVPVLGKIANFDDLDPLKSEPDVDLIFVRKGQAFPENADLIILPGSKSTIPDMAELRENGWLEPISRHASKGGQVIGICGGYQMLGQRIFDPDGIEGDLQEINGLGLLDVETVLAGEKTVCNTSVVSTEFDMELNGYEIHMGETSGPDTTRPMIMSGGQGEGAMSARGNVRGCYLHGLFGNDGYRRHLLAGLGGQVGERSHLETVEAALDELAAHIEQHIDVEGLLRLAASR